MPRKKNSRAAQGAGNIRKKTVLRNGKEYTFWEARVNVGRDPGTGKQIRRSFSGKTQKEVREKMQAAAVAVNDGDYFEPSKMTVGRWLDTWAEEYLNSVKPRTVESYKANIKQHIKPAIGALRLSELTAVDVQRLYNNLTNKRTKKPLSAKSKKNVHGTLHKALEKAVSLGYIRHNPADKPDLPKVSKTEIKPLADDEMVAFLDAVKGCEYETIYVVTLFTGMREGAGAYVGLYRLQRWHDHHKAAAPKGAQVRRRIHPYFDQEREKPYHCPGKLCHAAFDQPAEIAKLTAVESWLCVEQSL